MPKLIYTPKALDDLQGIKAYAAKQLELFQGEGPRLEKLIEYPTEVIAETFEFDRMYSEREVNLMIADFYDDFCTIRRDMVSECLLGRNGTEYWRIKNN